MPEFKCPRCNATLREEDCWITESRPWGHMGYVQVNLRCYCCTWKTDWTADNAIVPTEVELPA